jgi:hypothetical protein
MGAAAGIQLGAALGGDILGAIFGRNAKNIQLAKNENAALGQVIPWIQGQIITVFNALNLGQISETQAIAAFQQIAQNYWNKMQPLIAGGSPATCSTPAADCKHGHECTAGCCVGCGNINPWISGAIAVVQAHGGTAQFNQVFGSPKYGYNGQPAFSLKYSPPQNAPASSSGNGSWAQGDTPAPALPIGLVGTVTSPGGAVTPYSQVSSTGLAWASGVNSPGTLTTGVAVSGSKGIILAVLGVGIAIAGVLLLGKK